MTEIERIVNKIYQIGRAVESHSEECESAPSNYDAVCEWAAAELARLTEKLQTLMTA